MTKPNIAVRRWFDDRWVKPGDNGYYDLTAPAKLTFGGARVYIRYDADLDEVGCFMHTTQPFAEDFSKRIVELADGLTEIMSEVGGAAFEADVLDGKIYLCGSIPAAEIEDEEEIEDLVQDVLIGMHHLILYTDRVFDGQTPQQILARRNRTDLNVKRLKHYVPFKPRKRKTILES